MPMIDQPPGTLDEEERPSRSRPPAKESRRGLWIALGALLALLCATAAFSAYQSTNPVARFKQADALFTQPYDDMIRYASANKSSDKVQLYFAGLRDKTKATRKGLADARGKVSALSDSADKRDYLAAAVQLDAALAQIEGLDNAWANADKLTADTQNAVTFVKNGNAEREAALHAVEIKDYATAKAKAKDALTDYRTAQNAIKRLDETNPGLGIASLNDLLKARIPLASSLLGVAEDYAARDSTSAVKGRTKYNDLVEGLASSAQPPMAADVSNTLAANWQKALVASSVRLKAAMAAHDAVMERVYGRK
jgi:hypothetical protein